ncbi:hypothetical protein BDA96_05G113100 [Sorghum bicolor]|uniref:Uncharacterized protein n=2 Tax=Sorghum bicolor TaxID=4558 RepID=A0A921UG40_SORBI|nr:hypothetical protein BDA96_05G113100 [Sorghum bicolor]KXG28310.1 hypothetical protein SORBI_3005G108400 [Sorghum bicolor]
MLETSSSHSGHTLAGSVSVQELSCLHEKVPATIKFALEGEMPPYLLVKDMIWQCLSYSLQCSRGRNMEENIKPAMNSWHRKW